MHHADSQRSEAILVAKAIQRYCVHCRQDQDHHATGRSRTRPTQYVVELCAGTSSAVKYHLRDDPNAVSLLIDLCSADFMHKHVPPDLHPRFTAVSNTDVEHLTYESLSSIVRDAWGIALDQVHVYHHSLMCQSLSGATCDCTNHFPPDGSTPITNLA